MKRIKKILPFIIIIGITISSYGVVYLNAYSERVNNELATNIIRLHVLANSDSEEDQKLKLEVRDRILEFMQVKLTDSKDIEESRSIIIQNQELIRELALKEIKEEGKGYDVKVALGNYPFPTKDYGDIALPAGMYDALRVSIGKGEGANWWCVLFPPLCFVDVTHGEISPAAREKLKNALNEEEYKIIASADTEEDIPIVIKFKIVEIFQDSKIKFAGLMDGIFGP